MYTYSGPHVLRNIMFLYDPYKLSPMNSYKNGVQVHKKSTLQVETEVISPQIIVHFAGCFRNISNIHISPLIKSTVFVYPWCTI